MGRLYVCVKVGEYVGLLTLNKSYMGYPSVIVKNWITIVHCDDGRMEDFPPLLFDVVEMYD